MTSTTSGTSHVRRVDIGACTGRERSVAGYHLKQIPRGVFGEVSKVIEEALELEDALEQGNVILALCEMADLYGALRAVAERYGARMSDLETMADATERAFKSGERK